MGCCSVPGCRGTTEFEPSAQAVLCTTCGTVTSEDLLSHEWDGEVTGSSLYFGPATLKSLRRVGGGLVGQSSREDKDRRHMAAMDQFIVNILTRLSCYGLAPRARTLFEQARSRRNYRWGQTSVLLAGACIMIVLRENKKSALFTHIGSLIGVSPTALFRKFTSVCNLLNIQVPPVEPLSLLPILQSHLAALVNSTNSLLPTALVEILKPLSPASVFQLASSLATLISQSEESSSYLGASACPTACAMIILALEGQAASSLPSYTVLASELGAKVGTTKDLVTCHYRDISKILEKWLTDVPWLIGPNHPDNITGKKKRRKSSQRDIVAMGMKDIVQFQEDIQSSQRSRQMASSYSADIEFAEDSDDLATADERLGSTSESERERSEEVESSRLCKALRSIPPVRSRSLLSHVDLASLALLSPMYLSTDHRNRHVVGGPNVNDTQRRILTSSTFPDVHRPTRLQLLVEARGGEDKITDDELFGADELESFIRDEGEAEKLRHILGWNGSEPVADVFSKLSPPGDDDGTVPTFWENVGSNNKEDVDLELSSDAHVISQWREASPFADKTIDDADNFDVLGEW